MPTLQGKVAIVTGGALGIGRAAALALAREGAAVVVADINQQAGLECQKIAENEKLKLTFAEADVSLLPQAQSVVQRALSTYGGVDILFNNVGIQPVNAYNNAEDTPEEDWDRIINVNLKSHFLMAKYCLPEMKRRGGGVIVNNASVHGLQSQKQVPAYAASKGGILALTRNLAMDYAMDNIRVLAICPGAVDTPLLQEAMEYGGGDINANRENLAQRHPLGRLGQPEDIANALMFLVSDKASFMTGEYLCVDGGLIAKGSWAE